MKLPRDVSGPAHSELKAGTLSAILSLAAERLQLSREQLLTALKL